MPRLKVLHLLESMVVGGAEKVTLDLCRGLADFGIVSEVLAVQGGELHKAFGDVATTRLFPKRRGPDPRFLLSLAAKIRAEQPDVVHCVNGLTVVNYGLAACRLAGAPAIVSVHGASHFSQRGAGPALWRRILAAADARIAVSGDLLSRLRGCLGDRLPHQLIYNSIEEPPPTPAGFREELLKRYGFPAASQLVVCVANLREVKGHRYLLQAVALHGKRLPDLRLLLIGSGELEGELKQMAEDLGVAGRVAFAGRRHDVPACLAAADLFVLPSVSEGTPLCILEAMRAALPVVATRVGGIPEIVEQGLSALLVPPADPEALAEALAAASDPALGRRMGRHGEEVFRRRFDRRQFLASYAELFTSIAMARRGL
jgi:glycosyltransferase involved in cell wall biosynthesis